MARIILDAEEDCVLNTSTSQKIARTLISGAQETSNPMNNNNFKIMDVKEVDHDEDDEENILIIRVNDRDVDGMSIDGEEDPDENQTKPSSSPDKAIRKKKKKHKKQKRHRKDKDEVEGGETFEVPKDEEEVEFVPRGKRKRPIFTEDSLMEDSSGKIILNSGTVYSLGNYCPRMLAGRECEEIKCAWTHYMMPRDAANQFTKVLQFRPVGDAFQFFYYFTNLATQEALIKTTQRKLEDLEEEVPDLKPKDVCREVYEEMFRNIQHLDLRLKHFMELIDISVSIYDVKDGQGNLVELFNKTHLLLRDTNSHKDEAIKLVKWAWSHLYLASVEAGLVLPMEFYNCLTTMLSGHKMVTELVEVVWYTSLLPTLSPSLYSMADVLNPSTCPPETLLSPHSNAVLTAQALSRLPEGDWVVLHNIIDIKPGLTLLMTNLIQDDPTDVYKFYESVPEMEGLEIPEFLEDTPFTKMVPALASELQTWVSTRIESRAWDQLAQKFCTTEPGEPEVLAEMTEFLVLGLSSLESELVLEAFQAGLEVVLDTRGGEDVHKLFWSQVGLGLLLNQVSKSEWLPARELIRLLTSRLNIDWLKIKPPAYIFADIERGMVMLFVLEVLVRTKQGREMVEYLKKWNFLQCFESEEAIKKRDEVLLSVLECLVGGLEGREFLDAIILVLEVMAPGMRQEVVQDKKRQEAVFNKILVMMINQNMPDDLIETLSKFELEPAVTRGLVMLLANIRNNMTREATTVYQAGVKVAVYCPQPFKRPLSLSLHTGLTMEEMSIILKDYLRRIKDQSQSIFINMVEVSVQNLEVTMLNRVSTRRNDALHRLETLLSVRPPLKLTRESSVPYIEGRLVKLYMGKNY